MFDYTKAAINTTVEDLKKFFYCFSVASQSIYIIYLIYAICASAGNLAANIILLAVASAYFVFYVITHGMDTKHMRRAKGITRHSYIDIKLFVKALTLGFTIYSIYATSTHVTTLSVILAALTAVGWLLQAIFELTVYFVESRVNFIIAGIEADRENIIRPAQTVGNMFKKLTGAEVAPEAPSEPSRARKRLDIKVSEAKEKRKRKKQEKSIFNKLFRKNKTE